MLALALPWIAALFGLISAACWLKSAFCKITGDQARARNAKAKATGAPATLPFSIGGMDLPQTLAEQSKWSAAGATFAAVAVVLQSLAPLV